MMRVLHVVSHIGTYGGERFVPALARAQRNAGLDAAIVTICDSPTGGGVPIYSLARNGREVAFFFRLVRLLRDLRPDVVHTHLAHAKHWGRLAAVVAGVPAIVHTEHGNAFDDPWHKRTITRLLHGRTTRIVAFSDLHAARIAEHDGAPAGRIVIIPNGIEFDAVEPNRDVARASLGIAPSWCAILCVGRLDIVKRHDLAIDALALAPPELDAHLFIAGEGALREALLARARERGVAERVHLLGYRDDVRALLSAADAIVNSSSSEAMPLALLEAMCAGVPIVCTPWPGAAELLAGVGNVAPDFSARALAAALERALKPQARLRAQRATSGARLRFSIAAAGECYATLYATLDPPGRPAA